MRDTTPGLRCAQHAREAATKALHGYETAYPTGTVPVDPLTAAVAATGTPGMSSK